METVSFGDLAPILAAVVGPMLAAVLAMMRYQHVDGTKTRTLIHEQIDKCRDLIGENRDLIEESNKENRDLIRENRDLIEKSSKENRELIEKSNKENRDLIRENRELIERNHREVTSSLGEVRERLARIEGHLQLPPPPEEGEAEAA